MKREAEVDDAAAFREDFKVALGLLHSTERVQINALTDLVAENRIHANTAVEVVKERIRTVREKKKEGEKERGGGKERIWFCLWASSVCVCVLARVCAFHQLFFFFSTFFFCVFFHRCFDSLTHYSKGSCATGE